jgi:hypothetical protein
MHHAKRSLFNGEYLLRCFARLGSCGTRQHSASSTSSSRRCLLHVTHSLPLALAASRSLCLSLLQAKVKEDNARIQQVERALRALEEDNAARRKVCRALPAACSRDWRSQGHSHHVGRGPVKSQPDRLRCSTSSAASPRQRVAAATHKPALPCAPLTPLPR